MNSDFLLTRPRARRAAALLVALLLAPALAVASVGINKSFAPNSVVAGQVSVLTITLLNPNSSPATGVNVTDTLPNGVTVASPVTIGLNECGFATGAIVAGTRPIPLTGGTILAIGGGVPGQCRLTINVVSSTPSTYLNTIAAGSVASSNGTNPQDAQATLVVSALVNITGAKAFSSAVHGNGAASTLTITLTNSNVVPLTLSAAFTDPLPATLDIAPTPNANTTCIGGSVSTANYVSAASPANVSLATGAQIPASGSCTIKVDVIARTPNAAANGNSTNTIVAGMLKTVEGPTSPAIAANILVQTGGALTKSFNPATIPAGGTTPSTLTITVTNFNDSILSPITFTDNLPVGMTVSGVPTTTCTGALSNTATSVTLTGASLAAFSAAPAGNKTCTITLQVLSSVTRTNSIAAGTWGGTAYSGTGNVTLTVSTVTGSKAFSAPVVQTGTTTMTITLTNTSSVAATITSVTDSIATMGAGFTFAAAPAIGGTCGSTLSSSTATSFVVGGGAIPANGSCTITVGPISVGTTATAASHTNTIAVNGVVTNQGNNTGTITGAVTPTRALTVAKAFNPASVQAGTKSRLTVTLTRAGGASALTNINLTDSLATMGAGFTVINPGGAYPTPPATTCAGATLNAVDGATSFGITGGGLAGGAGNTSCTISLDVATTGATTGNHTNSLPGVNVTTAEGVVVNDATGVLAIASSTVTVNKSFSPTTVAVGGTSTMSIQIRNNNAGAINLTGVGLVDSLPAGMVVANPPAPTSSGCSAAPTVTAVNGSTSVTIANGSVNANTICTVNVTVRASVSGNLINNIPPSAVTSLQGVTNPLQGTATLAATGTVNLTVTKTDGVLSITPGTSTTYTVKVSNAGPNTVTGLLVNDTLPVGVTFTAWSCVAVGAGTTCTASGSGPIADSVTIPIGGSVTYTVTAAVAANALGSITNTVNLVVPGSVINTGGSTASDTDSLTPSADMQAFVSGFPASANAGTTVTGTATCTNAGPSTAANATCVVTGLPVGATVNCVPVPPVAGLAPGSSIVCSVSYTAPASGTVTALVTAGSATADPNAGNNTAQAVTGIVPVADLSVTKVVDNATPNVGANVVFTVTVKDNGPSDATAVVVTDLLPGGFSFVSAVPSQGSYAAGTGVWTVGSLANGASATLAITATVKASGAYANTASLSSSTPTDTTPANNSQTVTPAPVAVSELTVTKSSAPNPYVPGLPLTYTMVVTNAGPSDAVNARVQDTLPAPLAGFGWTCVPSGPGASCGTASGSGDIDVLVTLPVGTQATFTVTGTIPSSATGTIINTVTVTPPAGTVDPVPGDNTSSVTNPTGPKADLAVTKSSAPSPYVPGLPLTYTMVVTNAGPSDAVNARVQDALPPPVAGFGWTCVPSGAGASCGTASGSGDIDALVTLPVGTQATFTVTGTVPSGATGAIVNTVTVTPPLGTTDPVPGNNLATDNSAAGPAADLAVTKSSAPSPYVPGLPLTYTMVVTNAGPSDAVNARVQDALPAPLAGFGWTCVPSGVGASCGTASGSGDIDALVTLPIGTQTTFTLTGTVPSGATGAIANTVTVTPPLGTSDPAPANNAATDNNAAAPKADLSVTKAVDNATPNVGTNVAFTVTVKNNGPSDAAGVVLNDLLPTGYGFVSAVPSVGSYDGVTGVWNIGAQAIGATATLTITATVSAAGSYSNTATATAATSDPDAANNSATASTSPVAQTDMQAFVSGFPASANAGTTVTGTATCTNAGPSTAANATCAVTGLPVGATVNCVPVPPVAGLAVGSSIVCSVSYTAPASGTVTALVTAGSATADPNGGNNTAQAATNVNPQATLVLAKSGPGSVNAGGSLTYSLVVTNSGPSAADGAVVKDPAVANLSATSVTCPSATGGAACPATLTVALLQGSGLVIPTLPLNGAVTLNVIGTAGLTGTINNSASATPPAGTAGNGSASTSILPVADVGIAKTGPATIKVGSAISYTLTISNAGPSVADGATFMDNVPAAVSGVTASCGGATGGASCGTVNVSGNSVSGTVPVLPVGGSVVITITGNVAVATAFTNTATVSPPPGTSDPNPSNSVSSASTSAAFKPTQVPVDAKWALALLVALMSLVGSWHAARRRRR